jgi:hypothetical protein
VGLYCFPDPGRSFRQELQLDAHHAIAGGPLTHPAPVILSWMRTMPSPVAR